MADLWHIDLFGQLRAQRGRQTVTRFRTQKTAALLAYLAYHLPQAQPREILIDRLWPNVTLTAGRQSLSTALTSLRQQLEPPGTPAGSILVADRQVVGLSPKEVTTDVLAFNRLRQVAANARARGMGSDATGAIVEAVALYKGALLAGFYEDWSVDEANRLSDAYRHMLGELVEDMAGAGQYGAAIDYAHRAVAANPVDEAAHRRLMQLYIATGQPAVAQQHFAKLVELLEDELGMGPEEVTIEIGRTAAQYVGRPTTLINLQLPATSTDPPLPAPVTDPSTPAIPAPASGPRRHNLPAALTRFIGREVVVAEVNRLLDRTRLLTVTGTGGAGKTRLAIHVASMRAEADRYADGAWLVELANISDPQLVHQAVLSALGVHEEPGQPIPERLGEHLADRMLLLVLDNCEHLSDACASLAEQLLRKCPRLTILATSRAGLRVPGETTFRVPSLTLPDSPARGSARRPGGAAALFESEAATLFVDRAQAVDPYFRLTDQNAAAVSEICRRLDGIPLALELAAARVRALSVDQMAARLGNALQLLGGRSAGGLRRWQTLRALLDWSYELLSSEEQRLFDRLAVFSGGWTLEAAEAVCAGEGLASDEVLDLLTELVEKSLVSGVEDVNQEMRYNFLETVRQYALDRLAVRGELITIRDRHLATYRELVDVSGPGLRGGQQLVNLLRLDRDIDNIRAALGWCKESTKGPATALAITTAMATYWHIRGFVAEGRAQLAQALALDVTKTPTEMRARALNNAGGLALRAHQWSAARILLEECLTLHQGLNNRTGEANVLMTLGNLALDEDDLALAEARYSESLAIYRALDHAHGVAAARGNLGNLAFRRNDFVTARVCHAESLEKFRVLGNQRDIAFALGNLGEIELAEADYSAARAYFDASLAIFTTLDDHWGMAWCYNDLGLVAAATGDLAAAGQAVGSGLMLRLELEDQLDVASSLLAIANLRLVSGHPQQATRLLASADALLGRTHSHPQHAEDRRRERDAAIARAALGDAVFAAAWAAGRALDQDGAVAEALAGFGREGRMSAGQAERLGV